jgi:hypothetical protein
MIFPLIVLGLGAIFYGFFNTWFDYWSWFVIF